jgi:hypothetical protein
MPTEIRFKAAARFLGGETLILIARLQNGEPENQGIHLESVAVGLIDFELWGLLLGDAGYIQGVGGAFFDEAGH